ncbi:hypothetical protein ZWY2020_028777 [Hordeum vulgare]|nr:hypothetical protein ZWY2020_028777 [Hordeum vulgare]
MRSGQQRRRVTKAAGRWRSMSDEEKAKYGGKKADAVSKAVKKKFWGNNGVFHFIRKHHLQEGQTDADEEEEGSTSQVCVEDDAEDEVNSG